MVQHLDSMSMLFKQFVIEKIDPINHLFEGSFFNVQSRRFFTCTAWCNYDVRHSCFSDLVTKVADVKEKLNSTEHVLATSKEVEFRNKSQLTSFLKRGLKLLHAHFLTRGVHSLNVCKGMYNSIISFHSIAMFMQLLFRFLIFQPLRKANVWEPIRSVYMAHLTLTSPFQAYRAPTSLPIVK